jgi:hypothetical protein
VRLVSKEPYQTPPPLPEVRAFTSFEPSAPAPTASLSWSDRLRDWRKKLLGR